MEKKRERKGEERRNTQREREKTHTEIEGEVKYRQTDKKRHRKGYEET